MSPRVFLRYLALPARPNAALLIAVLSIGFALAVRAQFAGVLLALTLLYWLFAYACALLEHVAHGAREPPILALEMIHPLSQGRALAQLGMVLLACGAVRVLERPLGPALAHLLGVLLLLALPASMAAFAIAMHWWQALLPQTLWTLARALGVSYLAVLGLVLLYALVLLGLDRYGAPAWLLPPLAMFAWLSLYASIGGAVFEARALLGFEAMHAPERAELRQAEAREQLRDRFMDGIYAPARSGNHAGAWQLLQRELAAQSHAFETYEWMLARLEAPELQLLAQRLAQDYLSRALGRDNGRVLRIMRERLARDPSFRPRSGAETARVAQLARLAGDRSLAARLAPAGGEA